MNNFENNTPVQNIEIIKPEDLVIDKEYTIAAPYSGGQYEGQIFEGKVKFLESWSNGSNDPLYRFEYIEYPEHFNEAGSSGSTYQTTEDGLKYIKEIK